MNPWISAAITALVIAIMLAVVALAIIFDKIANAPHH